MASRSLTNTNVSDTYVGVLHAEGAPLPASGKADIYDGFGNKSALSVGREGEGIEVSGSLGDSFAAAVADVIYPVGSLFFSKDNNNPGSRMAGTSWKRVAEGQFIAGAGKGKDINGTEHTVAGGDNDTTGEYKHPLTVNEMPTHTHETVVDNKNYRGLPNSANKAGHRVGEDSNADHCLAIESSPAGGGQSHNNLPPAFGLYVWERIT